MSGWPVNTDLSALLVAGGLTAPSTGRMDAMLASAVLEFGRLTGYQPFLAANQTRLFDPPGYHAGPYSGRRGGDHILRLDNGLLSVSSLTVAGVAQTLNTDFWLRPSNAASMGKPYEWIEFLGPVFGQANAISITGSWGFAADPPSDAWWAVLYLAAMMAVAELRASKAINPVEYKRGENSERSGIELLLKLGSEWEQQAMSRVGMFKRVIGWL